MNEKRRERPEKNCGLLVVRINRISLVTDPAECPLESPRPPLVARVSCAVAVSRSCLAASPHQPSEPTQGYFDLSPGKINGPSSNSRGACQFRHQGMVRRRCSPTVSGRHFSHKLAFIRIWGRRPAFVPLTRTRNGETRPKGQSTVEASQTHHWDFSPSLGKRLPRT